MEFIFGILFPKMNLSKTINRKVVDKYSLIQAKSVFLLVEANKERTSSDSIWRFLGKNTTTVLANSGSKPA